MMKKEHFLFAGIGLVFGAGITTLIFSTIAAPRTTEVLELATESKLEAVREVVDVNLPRELKVNDKESLATLLPMCNNNKLVALFHVTGNEPKPVLENELVDVIKEEAVLLDTMERATLEKVALTPVKELEAANGHILCVNAAALDAHRAHGDRVVYGVKDGLEGREIIKRQLTDLQESFDAVLARQIDVARECELLQKDRIVEVVVDETTRKELVRSDKTLNIDEPVFCTMQYEPVCGVDGRTYSNSCFANVAGVKIDYRGACTDTTNGKYTVCYVKENAYKNLGKDVLPLVRIEEVKRQLLAPRVTDLELQSKLSMEEVLVSELSTDLRRLTNEYEAKLAPTNELQAREKVQKLGDLGRDIEVARLMLQILTKDVGSQSAVSALINNPSEQFFACPNHFLLPVEQVVDQVKREAIEKGELEVIEQVLDVIRLEAVKDAGHGTATTVQDVKW